MHLPQLRLRTHLDDLIAERDQALERAEELERQNGALKKIALVWLEDNIELLPGETLEDRLRHLIEVAGG